MSRFRLASAVVFMMAACATPGQKAVMQNDPVQLQGILARPDHSNENLDKLLIYSGDCLECQAILMKMGAKPTASFLAGQALQGHEAACRQLLKFGAEPSAAVALLETSAYSSVTGAGYKPEQIQAVKALFQKIEGREELKPAGLASAPASSRAEAPLVPRLAPAFHSVERPDDYALIVGIEKYDNLPAATYADRDAAAAADFVQAMGVPPSNLVTLTDMHATRSGLAKKLEGWLANNVNENSTVYFYYSGHGAPDARTGQAYLVPFDGDPEYLDQTGYPLQRLYAKLAALKAKRVIVMLDSCFSGAGGRSVLAKGVRPLVSTVNTNVGSNEGKISVLAAAGPEQISGMIEDKGHGLFSYYLFSGLNGAASDGSGRVTMKSLYEFVKPKVSADAHRANRDQVPQLLPGSAAPENLILRPN